MVVLMGQALAYRQAIAEDFGSQAELQRQFGDYIFATYPDADLERLTQAWQAILTEPLGEMMVTIAERLRHEGRAEGLQEGEARSLARLLERRFGPLPDEIATRIASANTSQLERWFEAAIDAPTCEAVFRTDNTH